MNMKRHYQALVKLSSLPRKIVSFHGEGANWLNEFVLHELCDQNCFNVKKAAYFVDNQDFDCLHGIAGFDQCDHDHSKLFESSKDLEEHLPTCCFHHAVRALQYASAKRAAREEKLLVAELAKQLGFNDAHSIVWDLKHHNHGILVYELEQEDRNDRELIERLYEGVHFLSLCPIC